MLASGPPQASTNRRRTTRSRTLSSAPPIAMIRPGRCPAGCELESMPPPPSRAPACAGPGLKSAGCQNGGRIVAWPGGWLPRDQHGRARTNHGPTRTAETAVLVRARPCPSVFPLREEPGVEQIRQIALAADLREQRQAEDLLDGL